MSKARKRSPVGASSSACISNTFLSRETLQYRMKQTLSAVIHKEEDMYIAECPEVGTVSQGKTIEEALNNLKEATVLYLEEFPMKVESKPLMTVFEVA